MLENKEALIYTIKELTEKNERQSKLIEKYRLLARIVHQAETWEYSIYDEVPDDTWIALDQQDYEKMKQALAELDELQPWKTTIEKRLGRV